MFKNFDHWEVPLGPDGTPYEYFESFRDWAAEEDRQIGWSENHGGFWTVVGYEAATAIYRDNERFSSRISVLPVFVLPGSRRFMIAAYDEPQHSYYRSFVQPYFSPKSVQGMREHVRVTANDLIDDFIEDGKVDVTAGLASEIPARVTALILGLPADEGAKYRGWVDGMDPLKNPEPEAANRQIQAMSEYFQELIAERKRNPGDDLVSLIAGTEKDGKRLDDVELLDFCVAILFGGVETTARLTSDLLWRLAWDRELRRRLIARPEMLPSLVQEGLRYYSPGLNVRQVNEPISLHGVDMEKDQMILTVPPIINRDPRQFPDPDAFIPDRSPNNHLGLGLGIHRCLGAHLLRMETEVAIEEFLRRIPEFELDPSGSTSWKSGMAIGLTKVPIMFPAGAREGVAESRLAVA